MTFILIYQIFHQAFNHILDISPTLDIELANFLMIKVDDYCAKIIRFLVGLLDVEIVRNVNLGEVLFCCAYYYRWLFIFEEELFESFKILDEAKEAIRLMVEFRGLGLRDYFAGLSLGWVGLDVVGGYHIRYSNTE